MEGFEKIILQKEENESKTYFVKITYGEERLEKCLENMLRAITAKIELDISEF